MYVIAVLSWVLWLLVFFNSLAKHQEGYGAFPYPLMLGWFIVNVAMLGA